MHSPNAEHLTGGGHDQEDTARLALVVGVDAVVGLLVPHEFEIRMLAGWQRGTLERKQIYAFGESKFCKGGPTWA